MTYEIRPASLPDVPSLVQHRARMFSEMGVPFDEPMLVSAFEAWLQDALPAGIYRGWVAETSGTVIAGAGIVVMPWPPGPTTPGPRCAFVFNVYTEPGHRGRGLARRLMETIHDWCRSQHIERLALNASGAGQRVYEAMGYKTTAEPMMRLDLR